MVHGHGHRRGGPGAVWGRRRTRTVRSRSPYEAGPQGGGVRVRVRVRVSVWAQHDIMHMAGNCCAMMFVIIMIVAYVIAFMIHHHIVE